MVNTKELTAKREEKLEGLIREAEASPAIQAVRAQQKAEVLAKRRETARRIEALRNEQTATIPKLQDALEATEAKYAAAKAAQESAAEEVRAAALALRAERLVSDNTIRNFEASLLESADPAIDAAILFFRDKLDELRTPGKISRNAVGAVRNIFTEKKTVRQESNVEAINSAMAYCRAALGELEQMKLLPAMDAEKIVALKAGIPKIDVYTEYTGERSMEKVPTRIIPRFGDAASDEYEQTLIDRVIKKANDYLSKPATPKPAGNR